jgi:hypothetical protein
MTAEQIEFKIREMLKSDFFSIEKVNVVQEDEQPPLILRPLSSHYQTSDVKFTCSLLASSVSVDRRILLKDSLQGRYLEIAKEIEFHLVRFSYDL